MRNSKKPFEIIGAVATIAWFASLFDIKNLWWLTALSTFVFMLVYDAMNRD